jgi:hypothetical protein
LSTYLHTCTTIAEKNKKAKEMRTTAREEGSVLHTSGMPYSMAKEMRTTAREEGSGKNAEFLPYSGMPLSMKEN